MNSNGLKFHCVIKKIWDIFFQRTKNDDRHTCHVICQLLTTHVKIVIVQSLLKFLCKVLKLLSHALFCARNCRAHAELTQSHPACHWGKIRPGFHENLSEGWIWPLRSSLCKRSPTRPGSVCKVQQPII